MVTRPYFNLTFGQALEALKLGLLLTREAWEKDGESRKLVFLRPADELPIEFIVTKVKSVPDSFKWFLTHKDTPNPSISFSPQLCLFDCKNNTLLNTWTPTIEDMLENDWRVIVQK